MRLGETRRQLSNRVRMEDAIRIDGNDNLGVRELQRVAYGARLPAIDLVSPGSYADVGKVALRFQHPLVTVVDRTVVLRDDFELLVWIIALADALDRFVDRFAFVVAGHQHADRWFIA